MTATADTLDAYLTNTEQQLQRARTVAELEKAATALDQPEFNALPEAARLDLGELYSHRFFVLTGALT